MNVRSLLLAFVAIAGCYSKMPYEGRTAVELEVMLESDVTAERIQGAFGLSLLGVRAKPATPALVKALGAKDPLLQAQAALALGAIGPEAHEAVPALTHALSDAEWTVRRQAAISLGQIGPGTAVPNLQRLERSDPSVPVRKAAREALGLNAAKKTSKAE